MTAPQSTLQAFNPAVQRVALGFTGPTSLWNTTNGNYGGDSTSNPRNSCTQTRGGVTQTVHALALDPGAIDPGPIPTFEAAGAAVNNGATPPAANNQLLVPKPAGTASGDFLLATIVVNNGTTNPNSTVITPPGGWTLIRRTNDGTNIGIATYRKVAGGSEPAATYTFGLTNSRRAVGGIVRYSGVDPANPVMDWSENNGNDTTLEASTVTVTGGNAALVGAWGSNSNTNFPAADARTPGTGDAGRLHGAHRRDEPQHCRSQRHRPDRRRRDRQPVGRRQHRDQDREDRGIRQVGRPAHRPAGPARQHRHVRDERQRATWLSGSRSASAARTRTPRR